MEPALGIYAVCDGMGGHNHGELAADLALRAMRHFLVTSLDCLDVTWPFGYEFAWSAQANRLCTGIRLANREVWRKSQSALEYAGMGTTVAAVLLHRNQAILANVGDSRIYRLRDRQLQQLSVDDTIVGDLLSQGLIGAEDVCSHPLRNVLLQAAGAQEQVMVHLREETCQGGDILLLCSDGLYGVVPETTILEALLSCASVQECSEFLEGQVLQLGGPDNIAIVALKCF